MKKSLLLYTTLFVIAGLTLAACAGNASASVVGDWNLVSYGSPTNPTPAVPNVEAICNLWVRWKTQWQCRLQ